MANKRGRPPLRHGEKSSTLSVRVTDSLFDDLCKFSRHLDVSLPDAARIKLDGVSYSDEEIKDLLVQGRSESKQILADAKEILEKITWGMKMLADSRTDDEMRHTAKHLAFILSQKYTH